jgi:hypothetical protein
MTATGVDSMYWPFWHRPAGGDFRSTPLAASQQPGGAPDGDQSAAAVTAESVAGPGAGKGRGPRPGRRSGPATAQ